MLQEKKKLHQFIENQKTNDYDPEHNDLELGLEGQHFKKSRISKAEWDLMKDTDHDELTAARASKKTNPRL